MLAPHDLVAAKILAQLNLVQANFLRGLLDQLSRAGDEHDLLARLVGLGALSAEQAPQIRRLVARFFRVVHESAVLREAERNALPPAQVPLVLARVEATGHVLRLTEVLVRTGLFTPDQVWELDEVASQFVFRNGVRMLETYRIQRYAGVQRPLIPDGSITNDSFRVSRLFRDRETQSAVIREIANLGVEQSDTDRVSSEALVFSNEEDTVGIEQAPVRLHGRRGGPDLQLESIGDYRVLECLGTGGMGAVFLTESPSGGMVAVKVLLPNAPPDDRARFEREATMCARVHHPSVVEILDTGRTPDGLLYLVLPAYGSTPLRHLIRAGKITPDLAFEVVEQVLDALTAVHAAGIVHRDVKPENLLLLTGTSMVRLVDFGIARFADESEAEEVGAFRTARGVASGSPTYVAPETLADDPFDARTDLYSVGVLFFELLTGRPPFLVTGRSLAEVARQHMVVSPPTLADVKPEIYWCPELELLVASLLAKIPEHRPPSARVVLDLLRAGLRQRSLELIEPGAIGRDMSSSWDGYKVV